MYTSGKREKRKNIQTQTQCNYSIVYINMYLTATCKQMIKWVVNFAYNVFKKIFFHLRIHEITNHVKVNN